MKENKCIQCGMCCLRMDLTFSRRLILRYHREDPDNPEYTKLLQNIVWLRKSYKYKGYWVATCNKLKWDDEKQKWCCSVYKDRPKMCSDYPYYDYEGPLDESRLMKHAPNCGFRNKNGES